ncbi:MAG TPA: M28 family peptidase [Aquificales bacterium]|nr:M28 family peptidase [Aquificales bacterium]
MRRDINFVLELTRFISSAERFPSGSHHLSVRNFLKETLRGVGGFKNQTFEAILLKPIGGYVEVGLNRFSAIPYTNSPSKVVGGILTDSGYGLERELRGKNLKGKIALVREGKLPFREKEKLLHRKGALGIVVFRSDVDEIYSGISAGLLPTVSVKPSDARLLSEGSQVVIKSETKEVKVKGENIWLERGVGQKVLTLIAHYDTKPFTPGAIDNALSVALLLWLTINFEAPKGYRLRILFTDLEEYGLLGATHFVENLPTWEIIDTVAISVDTVGWRTPAILLRDGEGFCSRSLISECWEVANRLGLKIAFTEGRSGRSDHIPFRRKGARNLFLASNPFPYRHTPLDKFEIVSGEAVKLWMKFIPSLLRIAKF